MRAEDHEREALASELADEAVRDLAVGDEARLALACMLTIDLLVDPALAGVLETELAQRKHLGPSGTVPRTSEGETPPPLREPALLADKKR